MKTILEELFYGNLCPNTDCRSKEKEVKELMGYIADHHNTPIRLQLLKLFRVRPEELFLPFFSHLTSFL